MGNDYYKGELERRGLSPGGMSKREQEVREIVVDSLVKQGYNAETAFFGVSLYKDGKTFRIVISNDGNF